jgi:type II secretory ATPase GspE/PulE/Tfp pilus assembly ATPase PilB-like protein
MSSIEDILSSENQEGSGGANELTAPEELELKMHEVHQKRLEEELEAQSTAAGLGYINLKVLPIPPDVLRLLPKAKAKELGLLPFFYVRNKEARFAVLEQTPETDLFVAEFTEEHDIPVRLFLTSQESFDAAFRLYDSVPEIKKDHKGVDISAADLDKFSKDLKSLSDLREKVSQVNVTELLTLIISAALATNASDIHIEVEEKDVHVRLRIDGVLHAGATLEKEIWQKVVSRVKLLAGLKINVEDRPQDGRFSIHKDSERIDVRTSTLPTSYGESVVLRVLRSSSARISFEDLGLTGKALEIMREQIERPNGLLITCGPTGAGKTTTLYAILTKLNREDRNIVTIEDPIEYELSGINQSQIDDKKNYTFASGLRSIVRQDPDVIMVGEMRDQETVEISINASLTGHFVLSTLHSRDAAGAIPRLLSFGAKPFLLTPALNSVIAQRLVRKICAHCKVETSLDDKLVQKAKQAVEEMPTGREKEKLLKLKWVWYAGQGCEKCSGLGYQGRIGIFEVFVLSDEVGKIIFKGDVSEYDMKEQLRREGMITMLQDGIIKARQGITSLAEVFRVID